MYKRGLATTVLLTSALAACAVGPDYQPPTMSTATPEQFTRIESSTGRSSEAPAGDFGFWSSFNDPELSALIGRALATNNDLHVALAHYDSGNALLREAKWDRFPTIIADGELGHQRVSQNQAYGFLAQCRCLQRERKCQLGIGRVGSSAPQRRGAARRNGGSIQ